MFRGLSPRILNLTTILVNTAYLVPREFFLIISYYFLNGKGKKYSRKLAVDGLTFLIIGNQL